MEARKNKRFLANLLAVFDLLDNFQMEKAPQQIQPAIALPDALPKVCRLVAVAVFRVARRRSVALVEGEEVGFGAG